MGQLSTKLSLSLAAMKAARRTVVACAGTSAWANPNPNPHPDPDPEPNLNPNPNPIPNPNPNRCTVRCMRATIRAMSGAALISWLSRHVT